MRTAHVASTVFVVPTPVLLSLLDPCSEIRLDATLCQLFS